METSKLLKNEEKRRFELAVDGHIAFIEYIMSLENIMYLTHTEVPKILGGKGVGKQMVELTLNHIKNENFKMVPLCPFVIAYLKRNSEWLKLLPKGYQLK